MFKKILYFIIISFYIVTLGKETAMNDHEPIHIFAALNFPLSSVQDKFTLNIFKKIDETFGAKGIVLDPYQIEHIKKTYLYLIFLTKLEKVLTNPKYKKYQKDFSPFLKDNGQEVPHMITKDLLQSDGWNQLIIDQNDLINSTMWQYFCKSMVTDIYAYLRLGLNIIHNTEKQEFNYIPHFETTYYDDDFEQLRNINAIVRIKLELEQQVQLHYLAMSNDWKNLPIITSSSDKNKPSSGMNVYKATQNFSLTEFYKKTHDPHTLMGTREKINSGKELEHKDLMSAPQMVSPLKDYVFCYFLLYELYGQLTSFITIDNLDQVISICSSSNLQPNIFPYTDDNHVFISELLATKSAAQKNHTDSLNPPIKTYKKEDLRKHVDMLNNNPRKSTNDFIDQKFSQYNSAYSSVQAQSFLSFFTSIGEPFVKAADAISSGVQKACTAVKNTAVAAYQGAAGYVTDAAQKVAKFGTGVGKDLAHAGKAAYGDLKHSVDSIEKFGDDVVKGKLKKSLSDLEDSVDDFAKALKDGAVAPVAEVTGDLVGFLLDDKKIGQDIDQVIDNASDALVNFAAKAVNLTIVGVVDIIALPTTIVESLAALVAAGALAAYGGINYRLTGDQSALNDALDICHGILHSLVNIYLINAKVVKEEFKAIMTALNVAMTSITTLFNDLIAEISAIALTGGTSVIFNILNDAGVKEPSYIKNANDIKNTVRNTLNEHRQIENQILGLAVATAVTIGTGGSALAIGVGIGSAVVSAGTGIAADLVSDSKAKNILTGISLGAAVVGAGAGGLAGDAEKLGETAAAVGEETATNLSAKAGEEAATNIASKAGEDAATDAGSKAGDEAENIAHDTPKPSEEGPTKPEEEAPKKPDDETKKSDEEEPKKSDEEEAKKSDEDEAKKSDEDEAKKSDEDEAKKSDEDEAKEEPKKSFKEKAKKVGGVALKGIGAILNIIFNVTPMISSYNQDQKNLLQQKQQAQQVQDLWKANTETKISTIYNNLEYLKELYEKQKASVGNQILGLSLFQNYNYSSIQALEQSILQSLAMIYTMQLYPQPTTNLAPGNTGTIWSLISPYLNLYPSQGFYTTTIGRNDFPFAQEIAQAPELLTATSKTKVKEWFNQRCTAIDQTDENNILKKPTDPLTVNINFKFLYTLDSEFYVGIYLGKNFYDYFNTSYIASLLGTTTKNLSAAYTAFANKPTSYSFNLNYINLNEAFMAKMVVLYRKKPTEKLKIGVYEHNLTDKEWIFTQELPANMQLDHNHEYNLTATLSRNTLQIALITDNQAQTKITQTVTVTPLENQRQYGIIASSAAIEWNQILPKISIQTTDLRKTNKALTPETERNKQNKLLIQDALNQTFGGKNLTLVSKPNALIFSQYIYASTQTDVSKIIPKQPTDFLIFATNTNGVISDLGKAPNSFTDNTTNVLVSLITGHVFDNTWNCIQTITQPWKDYSSSDYGPFLPKIDAFITQQQKAIAQKLSKIKFGSFDLDAAEITLLTNGLYVYTCMQTRIDNTGSPTIDYLVFTPTIPTDPSTMNIGLPPKTSNVACLVSLVTGNVYTKETLIPKTGVPTTSQSALQVMELLNFINYIQNLGTSLSQTISTLQQNPKPLPVPQPIPLPTIAKKESLTKETKSVGFKFSFGTKNFGSRQKQAAGGFKFHFGTSPKK
jgi:hypothetical protein